MNWRIGVGWPTDPWTRTVPRAIRPAGGRPVRRGAGGRGAEPAGAARGRPARGGGRGGARGAGRRGAGPAGAVRSRWWAARSRPGPEERPAAPYGTRLAAVSRTRTWVVVRSRAMSTNSNSRWLFTAVLTTQVPGPRSVSADA